MDVLSDVLGSVRLSGSVLFAADFTAPFAIYSPPSESYASQFVPNARRLILFHLVVAGTCIARCGNGPPIEAGVGDLLLLPYGDALTLDDGRGGTLETIFDILPPLPWSERPDVAAGGGGEATQLLCGFLHADELLLQPLLASLPPLLVIRAAETMPRLRSLQGFILDEMTGRQVGGESMVRRLVELLFVESLRHVLKARFDGPAPPLTSIGDPIVGKALMLLHGDPARNWTVDDLASEGATSRSVLAERFNRMVGCPPMEYLARWRMQLAARRMLDSSATLTEIAQAVGYDSDPGFSRSFRRHFGESPSRWRRARKGGSETKAAPEGAAQA